MTDPPLSPAVWAIRQLLTTASQAAPKPSAYATRRTLRWALEDSILDGQNRPLVGLLRMALHNPDMPIVVLQVAAGWPQ